MAIIVPRALSVHRRLGRAMGLLTSWDQLTEQDRAVGHVRVYTGRLLSQDVRAAGLYSYSNSSLFFKPFANAQMQLLLDECGEAWMRQYQMAAQEVSLSDKRAEGAFLCVLAKS